MFLVDGSTPVAGATTGAVAHAGGYPAQEFLPGSNSTIAVSGFTAAITPGQYITFGTHMQFYEVMSVVGGATPTSLTIFPPLQMAVANLEVIHVHGNAVYIKIGEGNLTYDEKRNIIYVKDRGFLDTTKLGDDEPIDVAIDFTWEFLTSPAGSPPPTVEEALKKTGNASNWVSTSVDPCEPYAVDIVMLNIPPCVGATDAENLTLPEFRWLSLDHDLRAGRVSVRGTCNVLLAEVTHAAP
jgi:hypothetical protein